MVKKNTPNITKNLKDVEKRVIIFPTETLGISEKKAEELLGYIWGELSADVDYEIYKSKFISGRASRSRNVFIKGQILPRSKEGYKTSAGFEMISSTHSLCLDRMIFNIERGKFEYEGVPKNLLNCWQEVRKIVNKWFKEGKDDEPLGPYDFPL
ncbi:MAG: hypothetical protein ABIB79_04830 [archaeon]